MQSTNEYKVEYYPHFPQQIRKLSQWKINVRYYILHKWLNVIQRVIPTRQEEWQWRTISSQWEFTLQGNMYKDKPFHGYGFHRPIVVDQKKELELHPYRVWKGSVVSGGYQYYLPINIGQQMKETGQIRFELKNGIVKHQNIDRNKYQGIKRENMLYRNGKLIKQWSKTRH